MGEHGCPLSTKCGERTHLAGPVSIVFVDCFDTWVVELRKEESVEITFANSEEWYASEFTNKRVEAPLCIKRRLACLLRTKSAHVEGLEAVIWVMITDDQIVLGVSRMKDRFWGSTGIMKSIMRGGLELGGILFNEDECKSGVIWVVAAEPVEILVDKVICIGRGMR